MEGGERRDGVRALKASVARHPLAWFFALALVPTAIARSSLPGQYDFGAAFAAAAVLFVGWACDDGERDTTLATKRLATIGALAIVFALIGVMWRDRLTDYFPIAVATTFVLSRVFSPRAGLRQLVEPLLAWRAPRNAYLFALLVWPLLLTVVDVASRLGPHSSSLGDSLPPFSFVLHYLLGTVILSFAPLIAWYAFAARRLVPRFGPLSTALVIGALPWLADTVPTVIRQRAQGYFSGYSLLATVFSALSTVTIGVWLMLRSRGSLLPLLLLIVMSAPSAVVILFWWGMGDTLGGFSPYATVAAQTLLALALVVRGRLWRREPPAPAELAIAAEPAA
jgi:hypothetical protein